MNWHIPIELVEDLRKRDGDGVNSQNGRAGRTEMFGDQGGRNGVSGNKKEGQNTWFSP